MFIQIKAPRLLREEEVALTALYQLLFSYHNVYDYRLATFPLDWSGEGVSGGPSSKL